MSRKLEPKKDDPEESKRFKKMAREVGVDEDPKAIDRAFERVLKDQVKDTKRIR